MKLPNWLTELNKKKIAEKPPEIQQTISVGDGVTPGEGITLSGLSKKIEIALEKGVEIQRNIADIKAFAGSNGLVTGGSVPTVPPGNTISAIAPVHGGFKLISSTTGRITSSTPNVFNSTKITVPPIMQFVSADSLKTIAEKLEQDGVSLSLCTLPIVNRADSPRFGKLAPIELSLLGTCGFEVKDVEVSEVYNGTEIILRLHYAVVKADARRKTTMHDVVSTYVGRKEQEEAKPQEEPYKPTGPSLEQLSKRMEQIDETDK